MSDNKSLARIVKKSLPEAQLEVVCPYVIAEAGVNHEGSLDLAFRLIDEAKSGGADAIKFQTYRADSIAVKDSPAYWDTQKEPTESQYLLFKKYDTFWKDEYEKLKNRCVDNDIEFLSTPFDLDSAKFLNELMEVFKISSSDITNRPFIEQIADFNKPILLSTGASNKNEIDEALSWIRPGKVTTSLMHCVLNYPTRDEDANLNMITDLKKCYPDNVIGYSDHTLPGDMHILEIASLLGAEILEKHFTHDKKLPGNDHYHAMDKSDLAKLRLRLDRLNLLGGSSSKACLESEAPARQHARRSLVAQTQILAGTTIKDEHLTWKRPASGISPREIKEVIGKVAKVDIGEDELLLWEMIQ